MDKVWPDMQPLWSDKKENDNMTQCNKVILEDRATYVLKEIKMHQSHDSKSPPLCLAFFSENVFLYFTS